HVSPSLRVFQSSRLPRRLRPTSISCSSVLSPEMHYFQPPVDYIEPVFRPPSEADSLILQVTNGCSWNRCTFCDMYIDDHKRFRPKPESDVLAEIERCGQVMPWVQRVFLADGDAMALSVRRLCSIL